MPIFHWLTSFPPLQIQATPMLLPYGKFSKKFQFQTKIPENAPISCEIISQNSYNLKRSCKNDNVFPEFF